MRANKNEFRFNRWLFIWPVLSLLMVCLSSGLVYATSYDYDELGRLISVTDDNGEVTVYRYDESGNLLAVEELQPGDLNIINFSPNTGSAGTVVHIAGTGFAPNAVDNTVFINGTSAQVLTASPTALSIMVPAGATTGLIQVDTPTDTAFSDNVFTVADNQGLPVVISISSQCLAPGQTLTVDGFYLGDQATTRVEIGDSVATATVESDERLTVVAPSSSLGGRVKVITSYGSAESEQVVAILSGGCGSFDSARWIETDTPLSHPGVPGGKKAYWFFRGEPDQWMNLQVEGVNADAGSLRVPLKLHQPDGSQIYSYTLFYLTYTAPFNRFTQSGVYRLELGSGQSFEGELETPQTLTLDGPPLSVATGRAQRKRFVVPLDTDYGFSLGAETFSMTGGASGTLRLRDPAAGVATALDGSASQCTIYNSTPSCGVSYTTVPPGDAYVLEWVPYVFGTSADVDLVLNSIQSVPLAVNTPVNLDIQRAGQTINYTFQGITGNTYPIAVSNLDVNGTENRLRLYLFSPSGQLLSTVSNNSQPILTEPGGSVTYQNVPETGEYTLRVVPYNANKATADITLDGGQAIDSTPVTISATTAGVNAYMTLDAMAGETYGFGFTNLNIQAPNSSQQTFDVKLYSPSGLLMPVLNSVATSHTCNQVSDTSCDAEFIAMPETGTYSLVVEPNSAVTGYSFDVQAIADLTEPVEYTTDTHSLTTSGQNARLSFTGQPGQAKQIVLTAVMPDPTDEELEGFIQMPDGTWLASAPLLPFKFRDIVPDKTISIGDFPVAGEYHLYLDPDYASTADFTVRQDDGVVDTENGGMTPQTVIPGPWRRVEFIGQAGDRRSLALHNVDLTPPLNPNPRVTLIMYDADGNRLLNAEADSTSASCNQAPDNSWDCDLDLLPLPQNGTYQAVAYLPVPRGDDIVTADAIVVSDVIISDTMNDFNLSQGQNGHLEFPVTAGDQLNIVVTRNTGIDAGHDIDIWVRDPSGQIINQRNMAGTTAVTAFTVVSSSTAVSGTYRIEIDPVRGRTAAVNVSVE